jgi:acyl-CoA reductase-like NAD-dependent aldehyde dehydrogenase
MDDAQIAAIARKVMARVSSEAPEAALPESSDGVFTRMEDAIAAAEAAQKQWVELTLERRNTIICAMRKVIVNHARELAELAVSETGMGRVEQKVLKNTLAATRTPGPDDIPHVAYSGDHGVTLEEYTPFGVVGSITPSTNPSETITNNAILALSAGNAIVFNYHPGAKRVSLRALTLINRAITDNGGPRNMLATVSTPTLETAHAIFTSPGIKLLVVTGGGGVVKDALKSGKRCLAAGPGNPPVIVDETADIDRAGKKIVEGASLDNNIVCIAEKEIFAVESIADSLKAAMKKHGGYELRQFELDKLLKTCLDDYQGPHGGRARARRDSVGRDPHVLAKRIGLTIPESTRILFCDVGGNAKHPLVQTEQLMPIIPLVRMPCFESAMAAALDAEHGYSHTAMMHSTNLERVTRFGRAANCSIFVVNGSCYNGLGLEGEGPTAWSITTPTGEGCTTPRNFARKRRLALVGALKIY